MQGFSAFRRRARLLGMLVVIGLFAQVLSISLARPEVGGGIWRDVAHNSFVPRGARMVTPNAYRLLEADNSALTNLLRSAPPESAVPVHQSSSVLTLPLPDGGWSRFRIVGAPLMEPQTRGSLS